MITEAAIQLISKSSNILEIREDNHQRHCDIYETIYNLGIKAKIIKLLKALLMKIIFFMTDMKLLIMRKIVINY